MIGVIANVADGIATIYNNVYGLMLMPLWHMVWPLNN